MLSVISAKKECGKYEYLSNDWGSNCYMTEAQQDLLMNLINDVINIAHPIITSWRKELQK